MSNTPSRGAQFLNMPTQASEESAMPPRAHIPEVYGYDNPAPAPTAPAQSQASLDGMTPEMMEWLRAQMMQQNAPAHVSSQGQNQTQAARENWTTADRDAWRANAIQGGGIPALLGRADGWLQDNPGAIAGIATGMPGMGMMMHQAGQHFGGGSNPVTGSGWINPDTGRQLRQQEVTFGIGDPRNSMMRNPGAMSTVDQHYASQNYSSGGGNQYDAGKEWTNPDTGRTHY